MQIVTDDKVRLTGTVFSSRKIIRDDLLVLDTLRSGGMLRGWYDHCGVESAGDFELLTSKEIEECEDFHPDYGDGQRVSGGVVLKLVEQGHISIPRSAGRHNRLAIARIVEASTAL